MAPGELSMEELDLNTVRDSYRSKLKNMGAWKQTLITCYFIIYSYSRALVFPTA